MSSEEESDSGVSGSETEEEESVEEIVEEPVAKGKRGKKKKPEKDPNKPKRNMSAFFLYSQAYRAQVKEDNPDAAFGDIAKILSVQYKALPEKEQKKWQQKAEKEKIRYQEEMKHYVPPVEDSSGGRKKKAKKDPNCPKRNMSAYFLYSIAHRADIKEKNPEASFGDIAKLISAEFKALPAKERAKWDKKAEQDKLRYQQEMAVYNAGH